MSLVQLPGQQGPGFPVRNNRLCPVRHLPVQVDGRPVFLTGLQVVGPVHPRPRTGFRHCVYSQSRAAGIGGHGSQQPASWLRSPWSRGCAQPAACLSTANSIRPGRISSTASGHAMDCSPPMSSTVLPPLRHADSMDTDKPQAQPIFSEAHLSISAAVRQFQR